MKGKQRFSTTNHPRAGASGGNVIRYSLPLFNMLAIALSLVTVLTCNFFSYNLKIVDEDNFLWKIADSIGDSIGYAMNYAFDTVDTSQFEALSFRDATTVGVGLFSIKYDDTCSTYCDDYTDVECLLSGFYDTGTGTIPFIVARYCSLLAPAFGLLAFLFTLFGICCRLQIGWKVILSLLYVLAMIFQMGTFAMSMTQVDNQRWQSCFSDSSPLQCAMDTGSWFSVGSILVYFLLAGMACCTPRPLPRDGVEAERDTDDSDQEFPAAAAVAVPVAAAVAVAAANDKEPDVEKAQDDAAADVEPKDSVDEKDIFLEETNNDATAVAVEEKTSDNDKESVDEKETEDKSESVDVEEPTTEPDTTDAKTEEVAASGDEKNADEAAGITEKKATVEEEDNSPMIPFGCGDCSK